MDKRLTGILGEKLVCLWYQEKGYTLIAKNYRTRFGEIDIVSKLGNTVVVTEVKTRQNSDFYTAREAVTYSKQQKIKVSTQIFLAENNLSDVNVRFDVAEVYHPENDPVINVITAAFE